MFTLRQALLSAALGAALTASTQASRPMDEDTATNSSPPTWDIGVSNAAKRENANHPLMSLNRGTLTEVCKFLAANDAEESIIALGQVSIHMTGRILRPVGEYRELFQDELTRINNPDMRQAIRVELRKAINARADELATRQKASETQPEAEPKAPLLAPWKEILGENASLQHLIRALKMLQPDNIERLGKHGLLGQLARMRDKPMALALGAAAAQIFTEKMDGPYQNYIISGVLWSSCPLSKYAARGDACKEHFFTEKMDGWDQARIIKAALESSHPVSEYAALGDAFKNLFTRWMNGFDQVELIRAALVSSYPIPQYVTRSAACNQHLFVEGLSGFDKASMISSVLPLSNTQMTQLVHECAARRLDLRNERTSFISARTKQLLAGK